MLLLGLALSCKEAPAPERTAPPPAPTGQAPAPAPPWFQGEWQGAGATSATSATHPTSGAPTPASMRVSIDAAGTVTGSASLDLVLRGAVEGETVRVEAEGPGGHGVAVLRRDADSLRGTFHYSARGASQGEKLALALTRRPAP